MPLIAAAADRWLSHIENTNPDDYQDAHTTIMLFLRSSGKRHLDQVTPVDSEAFTQFLVDEGYDDAVTIHRRVEDLEAFIVFCVMPRQPQSGGGGMTQIEQEVVRIVESSPGTVRRIGSRLSLPVDLDQLSEVVHSLLDQGALVESTQKGALRYAAATQR